MERAVAARVAHPTEDFLSELIAAQIDQEGELAPAYLAAEADLLLFAGNVTTTHLLVSMMRLLLEHPLWHAAVLADRTLVPALVDETLRLEPPVQWLAREVLEDVIVGGTPIPAGSRVIVIWGSGNHDPERFEDPESFDLGRSGTVKHHLAFGRGIHRCLGAPLAQLEGRVAFERLLDRLPRMRLAEKNQFEPIPSLLFRATSELYVEWG
jgi:cytochrome P450